MMTPFIELFPSFQTIFNIIIIIILYFSSHDLKNFANLYFINSKSTNLKVHHLYKKYVGCPISWHMFFLNLQLSMT